MQLDFAVLCDAANVREGMFNMLSAGVANINLGQLPGPMMSTLAINIWYDREDHRQNHTVDIRFITEDGHPMPGFPAMPQITMQALPQLPPPEPNPHAHYNRQIVVPLYGVQLTQAGNFAIDILLDGRAVKRIPFRIAVVGGQPPGQPPGPQMPRMM